MRIENSPKYEKQMAKYRAEREAKEAEGERQYKAALKAWHKAESHWLPMDACPFAALDDRYGFDGTILVSDGKQRALVTVKKRFGRPVFYKKQPELVKRDGMLTLVGGEEDPRNDLPAWWWKWELTDEHGSMTYAGGEERR